MVAKRGMTTRDALIAATRGGPDLRGLAAETGTLDVGMLAALIAIDGDSLIEPGDASHVAYVMIMGRPMPMKD